MDILSKIAIALKLKVLDAENSVLSGEYGFRMSSKSVD